MFLENITLNYGFTPQDLNKKAGAHSATPLLPTSKLLTNENKRHHNEETNNKYLMNVIGR